MADKKYIVWLSALPGIGSRTVAKLIDHFKIGQNVFEASRVELLDSGLGEKLTNVIEKNRNLDKIEIYMKSVVDKGVFIFTCYEKEYPVNLANIYDPPTVLYVKGKLIEQDYYAIGMVGSRRATQYGMQTAQKIACDLAAQGITIVSGMALGVDTYSHKGALEAGGRTIAVLGSGLNHIYPTSNLDLSEQIIKNGAIVSEYPLGVPAIPGNFPARNRIISGLSHGIIVVEAAAKSGTLITTDFALEQGRDVFAVPGNINAPNSQGTNELIKSGAHIITCAEDVFNEYNWVREKDVKIEKSMSKLNDIQLKIVEIIRLEPCSIDNLVEKLKVQGKDIIANISLMEIMGIVYESNQIYYIEER